MTLSPLQTIALATACKDDAVRTAKRGLAPGMYPINVTVRISGMIKRGEDTNGVIAQDAEPWKLLAIALDMLNGTSVDAIIRAAEKITDEQLDEIKARTRAALRAIKGEHRGPISGKTTAILSAEVVESAEAAAA